MTNLSGILKNFVVTSMLAIGPTFPVLMGSLDLSYLGIWMFGAILVWLAFPYLGMFSIIVYPLFGLAVGIANGLLHVKVKIPSFILTLCISVVFIFLTGIVSGGFPKTVEPYLFLTKSPIPYLPSSFLLSLPVIAVAVFLGCSTKLGSYLCAIGSNEEGVQLAGINVEKYKILVFTVSGLITGLGSIVAFIHLGARGPVLFDLNDFIRPLIAIVLGGTPLVGGLGGPHRTLLGALGYVLIFNGLFLAGINPDHFRLYIGAALVAAVAIASKGFKGVLVT